MEKTPISVLFVCLGNICRSPMAEGIFAHLVSEVGLEDHFRIDSAGTSGYHAGERADARMRRTASGHGISLTSRSRQLVRQDLNDFDYVVAMDAENMQNIRALANPAGKHHAQLLMMRDYDTERDSLNVPDPYWSGDDGFQEVFDILYRANTRFLEDLRARHGL